MTKRRAYGAKAGITILVRLPSSFVRLPRHVVHCRRWATLTAAAWFLRALPANAQSVTTAAGTGSATVTYTDNLYNAPSNPTPNEPEKRSAWFLALTPGLAISHERIGSGYALTYSHSFLRYLTAVEADAHGDQLAAAADYRLSAVSNLSFGLSGARSSTATLLEDPSAQGRPQPDASATFYTAVATQRLTRGFTREWAATQSASFGAATVDGSELPEPWRYTASGSLGAAYSLARDTWTFDWTGSFFHSGAAQRDEVAVPRTRYFETGPELGWAHVINRQWGTRLGGGLGARYSPEEDPRLSVAPPTFLAGLEWQRAPYAAALLYSASTDVNLFTNRVYYTDAASLSASWEILPRHGVSANTVHTVSANQPLLSMGPNGSEEESMTTYAWTSTAGLVWAPRGLPQVSLVYTHAAQSTRGDSTPETVASDFQRNQVALSVGWQYPYVDLGRLSRRSTFQTRGADADGADVQPDGAAPNGAAPNGAAPDGAAGAQ